MLMDSIRPNENLSKLELERAKMKGKRKIKPHLPTGVIMTQYLTRIIKPPTYNRNMIKPIIFLLLPTRQESKTKACASREIIM